MPELNKKIINDYFAPGKPLLLLLLYMLTKRPHMQIDL